MFINNLAYEASAGSGKTFMLVVRYLSLLFKGASPSRILALTFTNKAANEMQERIVQTLEELESRGELDEIVKVTELSSEYLLANRQRVLGEFLNSHTKIMTIDSFFTQILRKFSLYASLMPDFSTFSSQHELKLLSRFLKEVSVAGKKEMLITLSLQSNKRLSDIFFLLDEFYIKFGEVKDMEFKRQDYLQFESEALLCMSELKKIVNKKQCDFGVCYDGDADRLMMVDETGRTIGCDLMTALMVPYFLKDNPGATVVYDLRSSLVVSEEILKHGGTPRRERVGHSFMKKALRDSHAVFGGELSGHFYYRDNFNADSGMITMTHMLNIVGSSDKKVSELIEPLRRYYASGETNFKVENKEAKMDELARIFKTGEVDYLDGVTVRFKDWWFNCRPSNTEPLLRLNVEAKSKELLAEKFAEIEKYLGKPIEG